MLYFSKDLRAKIITNLYDILPTVVSNPGLPIIINNNSDNDNNITTNKEEVDPHFLLEKKIILL